MLVSSIQSSQLKVLPKEGNEIPLSTESLWWQSYLGTLLQIVGVATKMWQSAMWRESCRHFDWMDQGKNIPALSVEPIRTLSWTLKSRAVAKIHSAPDGNNTALTKDKAWRTESCFCVMYFSCSLSNAANPLRQIRYILVFVSPSASVSYQNGDWMHDSGSKTRPDEKLALLSESNIHWQTLKRPHQIQCHPLTTQNQNWRKHCVAPCFPHRRVQQCKVWYSWNVQQKMGQNLKSMHLKWHETSRNAKKCKSEFQ